MLLCIATNDTTSTDCGLDVLLIVFLLNTLFFLNLVHHKLDLMMSCGTSSMSNMKIAKVCGGLICCRVVFWKMLGVCELFG